MRVGNDPTVYSDFNEKVYDNIVDGGSFQLDPVILGKYVTLRREEQSPNTGNHGKRLTMTQLKLYQKPNLLQVSGINVKIT